MLSGKIRDANGTVRLPVAYRDHRRTRLERSLVRGGVTAVHAPAATVYIDRGTMSGRVFLRFRRRWPS
jgi:hypothetical protein